MELLLMLQYYLVSLKIEHLQLLMLQFLMLLLQDLLMHYHLILLVIL